MEFFSKQLQSTYIAFEQLLELKLFKIGQTQITLLTFVYLCVLSWLLIHFSAKLRKFIVNGILAKSRLSAGIRETLGSVLQYTVMFIGFIVLLQSAGIDLSALTVLLGALGIGISFGLQTITTNLVSGLIIHFERPIKVGDRIQIGELVGKVINISLRATTIVTNNNVTVMVPNSQFVTAQVVNWTRADNSIALNFPVTITGKEEPQIIKRLLLEIAKSTAGVLSEPAPQALLEELDADKMKFSLQVWTKNHLSTPNVLKSNLNFELANRLRNKNMEMSIPQSTNFMEKNATI
jgi:small-conductance mechanosensitive channel